MKQPNKYEIDQMLRNFERGKKEKYTILKLPCCGNQVEIKEPRDQVVYCPTCEKRMWLAWQQTPKVQYERTLPPRREHNR